MDQTTQNYEGCYYCDYLLWNKLLLERLRSKDQSRRFHLNRRIGEPKGDEQITRRRVGNVQ